jgi:hypothetical protein
MTDISLGRSSRWMFMRVMFPYMPWYLSQYMCIHIHVYCFFILILLTAKNGEYINSLKKKVASMNYHQLTIVFIHTEIDEKMIFYKTEIRILCINVKIDLIIFCYKFPFMIKQLISTTLMLLDQYQPLILKNFYKQVISFD